MAVPLSIVRGEDSLDPRSQRAADEILRVLWNYGVNPSKNPHENERTKKEFALRIDRFIGKHGLVIRPGAEVPKRTLAMVVNGERRALPRDRTILVEEINERALVAGAVLLRLQYRGLPYVVGVDALKREVIWILKRYMYRLPSEHAIFCPGLNDWTRHEVLWRMIRDYNVGEKLDYEVPRGQTVSCETCAEECITVLK